MQPPPPPPGYPQQPVPYGQPYGVPDAQGALVSMILGIIGLVLTPLTCCCGVGVIIPLGLGIAALVLGFQARSKVAAAPGQLGGSGKALAGIITGGTAVGISIVLLILVVVLRVVTPSIINAIPTPT
jgi:hypothetical protein